MLTTLNELASFFSKKKLYLVKVYCKYLEKFAAENIVSEFSSCGNFIDGYNFFNEYVAIQSV